MSFTDFLVHAIFFASLYLLIGYQNMNTRKLIRSTQEQTTFVYSQNGNEEFTFNDTLITVFLRDTTNEIEWQFEIYPQSKTAVFISESDY